MPSNNFIRYNDGASQFERDTSVARDGSGPWVKIDLSGHIPIIEAFKIGGIYINVTGTNPNTELGYGTWSAFGSGRTLVGRDGAQTEFDTVEETGGTKTETLDITQIPSHTHTQNSHNHTQDSHNHTQNAHLHTYDKTGWTTAGQAGSTEAGNFNSPSTNTGSTTATNIATTATNQATTATNNNTGGGLPHNNLPPYIVVYFWKRTA